MWLIGLTFIRCETAAATTLRIRPVAMTTRKYVTIVAPQSLYFYTFSGAFISPLRLDNRRQKKVPTRHIFRISLLLIRLFYFCFPQLITSDSESHLDRKIFSALIKIKRTWICFKIEKRLSGVKNAFAWRSIACIGASSMQKNFSSFGENRMKNHLMKREGKVALMTLNRNFLV